MSTDMYIILVMKHVHIAFRDEVLRELATAAAEEETSKSEIVRTAVVVFLRARARRRKAEAMRRYAEGMAPHSDEFTDLSGEATVGHLLRETDW